MSNLDIHSVVIPLETNPIITSNKTLYIVGVILILILCCSLSMLVLFMVTRSNLASKSICNTIGNDFIEKSKSLNSISSSDNKDIINEWCNQGKVLNDAKCNSVDPLSTPNFTRICCNGSDDIKDCTVSSRQCLYDSDKFTINQNNMYNILNQPEIWYKNKNQFEDYCNLGKSLISRNCIHENPLGQDNLFSTICCNGSSNISDCNTGAMSCLYNSSYFKNKDQYMTDQALQAIYVDGTVAKFAQNNMTMTNEYCKTGNDLLINRCDQSLINPIQSTAFQQFCCNGSTNPSDCKSTIDPCITDGGNFITIDYNISGIPIGNMNSNVVSNYCKNGISLLENKCETNPINVSALYQNTSHTTFQDLCCGGTKTNTRCNTGGIQCSLDATIFHNYNNDIERMDSAQIAANMSTVTNMCNAGFRLSLNDCQNYIPTSRKSYIDLCCNGDKTKCGTTM